MKKIIVCVILLTCSAISLYAQKNYSIKVHIEELNGKVASLEQFRENIYEYIDTVRIENNHFEFKGKCDKVINSAVIRIKGVSGLIPIFIEPGTIHIAGNASALHLSDIKGGKYSKAFCKFAKKDIYLYDKSMSLLNEHHRTRQLNLKDSADFYTEQYKKATKELEQNSKEFIDANIGNPLGLYYLRAKRKSQMKYDELTSELSNYDKKVYADNYDYKMIVEHIDILKSSEAGLVLENIILPNREGKPFELSSLRGKYVLIDFWASWCGPCRKEAKHLMDVYKYYEDENFEILGVSIDDNKESWIKAMDEDKTPWLHVHDKMSDYKRRFAIYSIPRLILIDTEGKIISSNIRGEELTKKLKEIFKK